MSNNTENVLTLGADSFKKVKIHYLSCPYAFLKMGDIYAMATRQSNLTSTYKHDQLAASSELVFELEPGIYNSGDGLIFSLVKKAEAALKTLPNSEQAGETLPLFLSAFASRLEDPGFLAHVMYYDASEDPDFLSFYKVLWFGSGASLEEDFFGGSVRNFFSGKLDRGTLGSAFDRFNSLEGVALDYRRRRQLWLEERENLKRYFMGHKRIIVAIDRGDTRYFVPLFGFVAQQGIANLTDMLVSATAQLNEHGLIAFDLPVKNPSWTRLVKTVGMPHDDQVFRPYKTSAKAIRAAHTLVDKVNDQLNRGQGTSNSILVMDRLQVLNFGAWGDTSVYVVLRKYLKA